MINQSLYADKLTKVSGILSVKDGPIEVMPGKYLIPGYSRYVIDKDLNIINIERNRPVTVTRTGNDYPRVSLRHDDANSARAVDLHRIVALSFLPVPDPGTGEKMEVDHINADRTDLRLENLEWVTKTENYKRGCKTRQRVKMKAFHVFFKDIHASSMYDTAEEVAEFSGLDVGHLEKLLDNDGSYYDSKIIINVVDTEVTTSHKNPIYVEDGTDGTGFIVKSVTEAATITGTPRTSINEMMISVEREHAPYSRGYRYYRLDKKPTKNRLMTLGEALLARYIRLYDFHNKKPTVGYILFDHTKNVIIAHRDQSILDKLRHTGVFDRKSIITNIYTRIGTSELSEGYRLLISNFNGRALEWDYILNLGDAE